MISFLIIKIKQLIKLPHFLILYIKDLIDYVKNKKWLIFEGWGLHLFVGSFGSGKTCSLVQMAYSLCSKYPQITVLTNFALYNFPKNTKILPLNNINDILNSPNNTLVLIDEIGTVFNSRDFMGGKGVPKILFQHICQCRKKHIQILATTQRWNFLDKQLRDITATITSTRMFANHPFSRLCTCRIYDAVEYDLAFSNPVYQPKIMNSFVYIQSDVVRQRYDTSELVNTIISSDYYSDAEILQNRGEINSIPVELSKGSIKKTRKFIKF